MGNGQQELVSSPGSQTGPASQAKVDDLTLARMVAQAVRSVPGVLDVTPGRFGVAATYGPGGRIPGVVLRRDANETLTLEVQVIASKTTLLAQLDRVTITPSPPIQETPYLLSLAKQIRLATQETFAKAELPAPTAIDIVIADLC